MWHLCNLTGHLTWKSPDSVNGVEKSAICTFEENRGGKLENRRGEACLNIYRTCTQRPLPRP